eukprot:1149664-Pelagomonas_calceolata.AAC.2
MAEKLSYACLYASKQQKGRESLYERAAQAQISGTMPVCLNECYAMVEEVCQGSSIPRSAMLLSYISLKN